MFGVIKQRFEILLNGFHMKDVEHIKMVTESCFLLHNYLREVESPLPRDIWEDILDNDSGPLPEELVNIASQAGRREVGIEIREKLVEMHLTTDR